MIKLTSKGKTLESSRPVVMGILNATRDSFYNKGQDSHVDGLLRNAAIMLKQGATILDVGGSSTKPGQNISDEDEELQRVIPAIEAIHRRWPEVWLSVDTYHAGVAREAVAAGASIVNDVSSGSIDARMLATVAELQVPYIAMHMQGTPATMQVDPTYDNVLVEVLTYLKQVCERCEAAGIADVIVDPGFGFGKTVEHNFALLRHLPMFSVLGRPVLAGVSRKSIVCKPLKVNPEHALNGTTALNMVALLNGANILRVHDVKEAMETIVLAECLLRV
ncbi:MAG: dihydropteroate synthase [Bacteroidota bacterium]